MPTISVIVPVYKVEKYIHRCVDSILGQTYEDFELILVDDGSPDNCGAICDEYAAKDSRIVVIHQENGGLSAARNAGIDWAFANSDSQWLTFIDSDDWVHPEYLQRLLDAALDHNASVSICGYAQTEGQEPEIEPEALVPVTWSPEEFYVEHTVNATIACAKLYRRNCFAQIRYPLGELHEDEFITYQILFRFPTVAVIQAPLYFYYVNPNSIVQSGQSRFREDKYIALEEQIRFFRENGFHNACRSQVRNYLCLVHDKIQWISGDVERKEFLALLKKKKRERFARYALLLDPGDDRDAWVLTKVFPKSMWIYWHLRALGRKLRIIK